MPDFLTIGIPVWRDAESLEKSVTAITKSTAWIERPKNRREIIICVNGISGVKDKTLAEANRLINKFPEIKIFGLHKRGRNMALNFIARHSNPKAKTVFFCDADILVKRQTIHRTIDALKRTPGAKFAGTVAMPATTLVPEEKRGSLKAFLLERARTRLRTTNNFISGAAYAVDKDFFLKNPLPETNNVGDDLYINQRFREKIVTVRDARVFYLLPNAKDRLLQKTRYFVQEKISGKSIRNTNNTAYSTNPKVRRGLLIDTAINKAAQILAKGPPIGWKKLPSTKLVKRKR